jgi:hypothetical protein
LRVNENSGTKPTPSLLSDELAIPTVSKPFQQVSGEKNGNDKP